MWRASLAHWLRHQLATAPQTPIQQPKYPPLASHEPCYKNTYWPQKSAIFFSFVRSFRVYSGLINTRPKGRHPTFSAWVSRQSIRITSIVSMHVWTINTGQHCGLIIHEQWIRDRETAMLSNQYRTLPYIAMQYQFREIPQNTIQWQSRPCSNNHCIDGVAQEDYPTSSLFVQFFF